MNKRIVQLFEAIKKKLKIIHFYSFTKIWPKIEQNNRKIDFIFFPARFSFARVNIEDILGTVFQIGINKKLEVM